MLRHTVDGGRTWASLPSLPAGIPADGTRLQFANSHVGYLFGRDVFYLTTDGGGTWTRQSDDAEAIAVANGTALRLSVTVPGCLLPGCTYRISSAPLGSSAWQTVEAHAGGGDGGVQLLRHGHVAIAALYGNLAGGVSARATVLTSGNDGRTWTTRPDPCPARSTNGEIDAEDMTIAPDGSITVLCTERGGPDPARTVVVTSTDGGLTFGPPHSTPDATWRIGAADAVTLFAVTFSDGRNQLWRSDNAGVSWTLAAHAPTVVPDSGDAPTLVALPVDARTGYWLPGGATILVTHDSGHHWSAMVAG